MRVRRTALTVALLIGILTVPLQADAQQSGKVYRVGFIVTTTPVSEMAGVDPGHPPTRAFVQGLHALGYVEGRNLILERRSAEGRFERFGEIVTELVRLNADVIVTVGNPMTQRAKELTTSVPIVMAAALDPVGAGLVPSLARPGGNITGVTYDVGPEIEAKRLELLKEALPGIARVAFLGTKLDWDDPWGHSVRRAARVLGVTLFHAEHSPTEYTGAFALISRRRPDAIFAANSPMTYANRHLIVDFATRSRLPSAFLFREAVELGGLMSYGVNVPDLFRRAATYVDKILKGTKPADLPVEQPTRFELVINLKTARALGLTIPQSILIRADQVIR